MEERSCRFPKQRGAELEKLLFEDRMLPDFRMPIAKVSYLDGVKVYFQDGGWIIARFSGTEPLLRIFCEMRNAGTAAALCDMFADFLELQ